MVGSNLPNARECQNPLYLVSRRKKRGRLLKKMRASTVSITNASSVKKRTRRLDKITLNMYQQAPTDELSLDEFEIFAIDRLMVLRGIEKLRVSQVDRREESERTQVLLRNHLPWDHDVFDGFNCSHFPLDWLNPQHIV